jgi:SAM-dependent methyltransferase
VGSDPAPTERTDRVDDRYSALWYRTFLDSIPEAQTAAEVAFLGRQLPLPAHRRILDLCCGSGRHAFALAAAGYAVTAVDRDAEAIARARAGNPAGSVNVIQCDVRGLPFRPGHQDAAILLWASFGYFSPDGNIALLEHIREMLRPRGRFVLDVYNREWFAAHQGEQIRERAGITFTERRELIGDRLTVQLRYDEHEAVDSFSWQVLRPDELVDTLRRVGFEPVTLCAAFDERVPASPDRPRMQAVAERRGR